MEKIKLKHNLTQVSQTDFIINIIVVKNKPEIKFFVRNNGKHYGIFDGGTVVKALMLNNKKNNPTFEEKLYNICKKRKVSKKGNVFFVETYANTFNTRLKDIVKAINEISEI